MDKQYEDECRKSIGDELYDQHEAERIKGLSKNDNELTDDSELQSDDHQMTVNELLGFIFNEVRKDLPSDWKEIEIQAGIGEENGNKLIDANFWYINDDSQHVEFEPGNIFGSMNAIKEIHNIMPSHDDDWTTVKISFYPDGKMKLN